MSDQEDFDVEEEMGEEEQTTQDDGGEEETTKDEEEEKEEGDEEKGEEDEEEKVEEEEEEKLPEVPLTPEIIPECISLLCKIGDGLSHAFVRLEANERDLTDISLLCQYIYLRYVDLSKNNLKDISPLNHLTELLSLKVDFNFLTSAKLEELPYLQVASFSNNRISSLDGVNHPLLEQLNMSNNEIAEVSGLNPIKLSRLHTLELRGNKLVDCHGFQLPNLRNLFLAQNVITSCAGLSNLHHLTTLHLRDNQLEKLDGFDETLVNLQYINLRGNSITDIKEVQKLQVLPKLRAIVMSENPCAEEDDYRMEVLITLRKIERLDKDEFTEDERREAEEIYEQRRQEDLAKEGLQEEIASDGEEVMEE